MRYAYSPLLWGWWSAVVTISVLWQGQETPASEPVLGAILLLLVTPAVWLEIRRGSLSAFLEDVFSSRRKTAFFLFLSLLFVVKFYWIPGYRLYTTGDGAAHFLNTWMAYSALQNGEIPFWTNDWACGAPFLQFYPPLFSYLSAGLLFLHENIFLAIRLLLTGLHILSGFTMYWTVRALESDRKAAFLSALVYAAAPWHVFQVFHFNRFPVAPVYALLPLLFLSTEMLRRGRLAAALLGGASLGGIALSHPGYAIFSGALFGLYTLIRSICPEESGWKPRKECLLHILAVGLFGMGLASLLLFPYLLESELLPYLPAVGTSEEIKGYIMDNPYLATLFLWSRHPFGHSGYLGISLFLFGVLGLVGRTIRRGPGWAALLVCCAFSYYLVVGHHNALYSLIPFVYAQFYAGRHLIFLVLFLSIGAGLSLPFLEEWMGKKELASRRKRSLLRFCRPRLTLILIGFFLADLGPIIHYLRVSPRYPFPDQGAVYARIEQERGDSPHRLARAVDIPKDYRIRKHGSLILPFEARCPTPEAGQFGTPVSYAYIGKILKTARENLPLEKGFPEDFLQAMYLLNVRYVSTDVFSPSLARSLGGENFGGALWLFTLPDVSPVLASGRIEDLGERWRYPGKGMDMILDRWNPPDLLDRIIGAMDIDMKNMRAGTLFVRDGPEQPETYPEPVGPVEVGQEDFGSTYLRLTVTAASDCYVRISQSFYPHQQVLLDGKPWPDVYRSGMEFIVIRFPAGAHTVEVRAVLSPVRKAFLAISVGVLCLMVLLATRIRKPKDRSRSAPLPDSRCS